MEMSDSVSSSSSLLLQSLSPTEQEQREEAPSSPPSTLLESSQTHGESLSTRQIIFVKFVFYMLGNGFLLPWNAFISAGSYFLSRLSMSCQRTQAHDDTIDIFDSMHPLTLEDKLNTDSDSNNISADGDNGNFMSWIGLLYNLSGLLALTFLLVRQRTNTNKLKSDQELQQTIDGVVTNSTSTAAASLTSESTQRDTSNINHESRENGRTPSCTKSPQCKVLVTSFSIYLLIMIITAVLVLIPSFNTNSNTIQLFKIITFTCITICGTCGAFISSNIISYANMYFPPMYSIQCYISGQAVGGVAISALNLVLNFYMDGKNEETFWNDQCGHNDTHLFMSYGSSFGDGISPILHGRNESHRYLTINHDYNKHDPVGRLNACHDYSYDWGAFSYFVSSCLCLILCIAFFIILDGSSITQYYRNQRKDCLVMMQTGDNNDSCNDRKNDLELNTLIDDFEQDIEECRIGDHSLIEPLLVDNADTEERLSSQRRGNHEEIDPNIIMHHVWYTIQSPVICIFVTFFITLTIFPSWIEMLESVIKCQHGSSRFRNDLFAPLMVVLFNVCDLLGRISSEFVMKFISRSSDIYASNEYNDTNAPSFIISRKISILSTWRLLFLPAFILCKNKESSFNIFGSDIYTFGLMILFAFSQGLVSTLSFVHAARLLSPKPKEIDDEAAQRVASILLNIAAGLGLVIGSMSSFAYNFLCLKLT